MRRIGTGATLVMVLCWGMAAQATPVSGQGTWESTLHARDFNNDNIVDAYYDSTLDLTWLADWNNAKTTMFDADGLMDWSTARGWANALNVHGVVGWRLPSTTDSNNDGCNYSFAGGTDCGYNADTASSELAHMFYLTLGNKALCPPGDAVCSVTQVGFGLSNTANFVNVKSTYWSGTESAPQPSLAWHFVTSDGEQQVLDKSEAWFAVAVRPGDVAVGVPEPQALGLLLAGLAVLSMMRRQRAS